MTRTGTRPLKFARPLVADLGEPPATPLHSSHQDLNGLQRLVSDRIQMVKAYSLKGSRFRRPDRYFTGYGADGYWYTWGELDPSVPSFEASWATETPGPDRGDTATFPERFFVVVTEAEVCIVNAETYAVWMRFRPGASSGVGTALGPSGWNKTLDIDFLDGFLVLAQRLSVVVIDFTVDAVYHLTSGSSGLWPYISRRNDETLRGSFERVGGLLVPGPTTGRGLSGPNRSLPSTYCHKVEALRVIQDYANENYEPTFLLSMSHGFAVLRMRSRSDLDPQILGALPPAERLPFRLVTGTEPIDFGIPDLAARFIDPEDPEAPSDLRDVASVGDFLNYLEVWSWPIIEVTETYLRIDAEPVGMWASDDRFYLLQPMWVASGPGRSLFGASSRGFFFTSDPAWAANPAGALPAEPTAWPGGAAPLIRDVVFDPFDEVFLVATDAGVYGVRAGAYQAVLLYGSADSGAEYPILPAISANALAVDVSARTLGVCQYESRLTRVVEIDTRNRRVLKTTSVPGQIRRLGTAPREV
jgi:hypothetical protein